MPWRTNRGRLFPVRKYSLCHVIQVVGVISTSDMQDAAARDSSETIRSGNNQHTSHEKDE